MPLLQSSPRAYTAQEKESLSRVAKEFNDMVRRTVSISADAQKMALRLPLITFQKEVTETSQKLAKLFSISTFESIQKIADLQKHQETLMTNMFKPPRFDFGQSEIKSLSKTMEVNLRLAKLSERSFSLQICSAIAPIA